DPTGPTGAAKRLAGAPRVRRAGVDFSPAAIEASTAQDVEDEGLPIEQRMQALLTLACLDSAHGRVEAATPKFDMLLGYYQQTSNHALQAFVLNAFGDMERRRGDLDRAQHWYECASPPAVESRSPVVLATVTKNLGDLAYERGQYAVA